MSYFQALRLCPAMENPQEEKHCKMKKSADS